MTSKKNRVLVGSPIHQKPYILQKFLLSLKRLDVEGQELGIFFIDDKQIARRFQSGAEQCQSNN
ncbi:hypothetical protein ACFX4I_21785 [Peribacillus sp. YIM B13472]|uniref:hypothetical protein n=1 Tax=Peribacillus sp. YIM B13472 TaxID=3366297 RepID=UPI00366DE2E3